MQISIYIFLREEEDEMQSEFIISEFSCHDSWQEEIGDSTEHYTIVSYKSNNSTR